MKNIFKYLVLIIVVFFGIVFSINFYIVLSTKKQINVNDEKSINVDSIIILGAGIKNGSPSPMLEDRLNEGIKLYKEGIASKIIMSGDHGREEYDEVNIMKDYAIKKGVPSEDVFMDHAGFSTYESVYRAKEIFKVKKVVIVTQEYHLYRALYIANELGIEAYGVNSDPRKYVGVTYRELREILARNKDFVNCIIKPRPTFLGESIPVSGNGNVTNDK